MSKIATKKKQVDKIDALICHGVQFVNEKANTARGHCPFCKSEDHFFAQVTTGKWQCKKCLKEGNIYTFLNELYQKCQKDTTKADYEMLSQQRGGLNYIAFKNDKIVYHRDMHRWLFPVYNPEKKLSNLLHWDFHRDPRGPFSTDGCSVSYLLGAENIKQVGPIHICEGAWDKPALNFLFTKCNIDEATNSVIAKPSAGTSLEKYKDVFQGREVILYGDNDKAGYAGMDKDEKYLRSIKVGSVKRIVWPETFPEGYDLRDFITERISSPKKALHALGHLFEQEAVTPIENLPKVPDFKALVKQFRKVLHLEQNQINALAVCVAVVASSGSRGVPLWVFLVGPPGSGKSEMLMSFSKLESHCLFVSRLTAEALISGMGGEGDDDPSILAYLRNRCLVVKDFTAVKAMNQERQIDLYGLMRDAYDGEVAKPFGNGVKLKKFEECWFPHLAGVTHVIHADNQSAYGERYLKFELLDDDHDVNKQTDASMTKAANDQKAEVPDSTLKNAIMAFFSQRKLDRTKLVNVDATPYKAKLRSLANIVAILRTSVEKKGAAYSYRPIPENPGRLGAQFTKMAQYLCWVFDKKKMDDEIYEIVRKVSIDTVISWALDIAKILVANPEGMSMQELTLGLQVSNDTLKGPLDLLCQIVYPYEKKGHGHIINIFDQQIEGTKRTRRMYVIDPRFLAYWSDAGLIGKQITKRKSTRGPKPGSAYRPRSTEAKAPSKKGVSKVRKNVSVKRAG